MGRRELRRWRVRRGRKRRQRGSRGEVLDNITGLFRSSPAWQLKVTASDSEAISYPGPANKTPKRQKPKVVEHTSPRSPMSGVTLLAVTLKKHHSGASELESHLAQRQEGLEKAKEQLNASETWKGRAQQDAEDAKKQLPAMSMKLEESEQQLMELFASEDSRVQELRKVSQDRDRARLSKLESVQKQHSMDSAAYASALNGIQNLKLQLETACESEAVQTKHAESAHPDIQKLGIELSETLSLDENLKTDTANCRESEAESVEAVNMTQMQLEMANEMVLKLPFDSKEARGAFQLAFKVEQSKSRLHSLHVDACKLHFLLFGCVLEDTHSENDVGSPPKGDVIQIQLERAKETVEKLCSDSRGATFACQSLVRELKQAEFLIQKLEEFQFWLYRRMTEGPKIGDQSLSEGEEKKTLKTKINELSKRVSELELELGGVAEGMEGVKASLSAKETELKTVTDQVGKLKMDIQQPNREATAIAEAVRAAEQEALLKPGCLSEEADKSSGRVERLTEQLDEAQAPNTELEAKLRRSKVPSDQLRKDAEEAAMFSTGNNGKFMERTRSLDRAYSRVTGNMGSRYSKGIDDDSPRKKKGNLRRRIGAMKRIGVLWKRAEVDREAHVPEMVGGNHGTMHGG